MVGNRGEQGLSLMGPYGEVRLHKKVADKITMTQALAMISKRKAFANLHTVREFLADGGNQVLAREYLPCWTGTVAAYRGGTLGREIVQEGKSSTFVFRVPKEHQGAQSRILLSDSPNYKIESRAGLIVVDPDRVVSIQHPGPALCYFLDPETGFPSVPWARYDDPLGTHLKIGQEWAGLVSCDVTKHGMVSYIITPGTGYGGVMLNLRPPTVSHRIYIDGVSAEQYGEIITNADASLADIAGSIPPEKLFALSLLIKTLRRSDS
jgi:hypothetical protein